MKRRAWLMATWLLLSIAGGARSEEANCGFNAWLTDADPTGTNIREQANAKARVIARLVRAQAQSAMALHVIGYSNGWLKIGLAHTPGGKTHFDGVGWIPASLAGIHTRHLETPPLLHSAPRTNSPIAAEIPAGITVRISGFACGFARINYQNRSGWLRAGHMQQG